MDIENFFIVRKLKRNDNLFKVIHKSVYTEAICNNYTLINDKFI